MTVYILKNVVSMQPHMTKTLSNMFQCKCPQHIMAIQGLTPQSPRPFLAQGAGGPNMGGSIGTPPLIAIMFISEGRIWYVFTFLCKNKFQPFWSYQLIISIYKFL